MPATQDPVSSMGSGGGEPSRGVLLAIAILLLWLAGFCFFISFEGSKLLKEAAGNDGAGLFKAMLGGLAQSALDLQQSKGGG